MVDFRALTENMEAVKTEEREISPALPPPQPITTISQYSSPEEPLSTADEIWIGDEAQDEVIAQVETPCQSVCGRAGTGKTYWTKKQIEEDRSWGVLAATTGIAAVNLDATTVNSLLGYFDTDSLRDSYLSGRLTRRLHDLAKEYRRLAIDEVSMMDKIQLELLYRALCEANQYKDLKQPMGLTLIGDFAQLPPVKAQWAFEADCWEKFSANTFRLEKIWRQDEPEFLTALTHARLGEGRQAAEVLDRAGIEWCNGRDVDFEGTTIVPKNDMVDRHNGIVLDGVPEKPINLTSRRWGKLRGEWKLIPDRLQMKKGAYVMILSNEKDFEYANGDCGYIEDYDEQKEEFVIRLARNGYEVSVPKIVRSVITKDRPKGWDDVHNPSILYDRQLDYGGRFYVPKPHFRCKSEEYVLGQIEYFPIRLAYASTVHKSQGLSLDKCQIDYRDHFFGNPGMLYVALSRCRTLRGLRLVGDADRFAKQCNVDKRIQPYL